MVAIALMSVDEGLFVFKLCDRLLVAFTDGHKSGGAELIGVAKSSKSGDFRSNAPSCCVIFLNGDIGWKQFNNSRVREVTLVF